MKLQDFYREKELVQVLDPVTKIWEEARILGFESSISVRVKYLNWSKKQVKKFGSDIITVSLRTPPSCWPIQKYLKAKEEDKSTRKAKLIRGKTNPQTNLAEHKKRQCGDKVHYIGQSRRVPTDIPSLMEIIDELKVSPTLKMGYVIINDPFQQIMGVKHEQTSAVEV